MFLAVCVWERPSAQPFDIEGGGQSGACLRHMPLPSCMPPKESCCAERLLHLNQACKARKGFSEGCQSWSGYDIRATGCEDCLWLQTATVYTKQAVNQP